jgi:hypothetical protein
MSRQIINDVQEHRMAGTKRIPSIVEGTRSII